MNSNIIFYQQQIIGKRDSQQDSLNDVQITPEQHLFVIADGMGGHTSGEIASKTAVQSFVQCFESELRQQIAIPIALQNALQFANQQILTATQLNPQWAGMGTTLLAICLHSSGEFHYISVGDSPLYQQFSGSLKRINANHSFADYISQLVAKGTLTPEQAAHHPQRHAITSALMGNDIPHIDLNTGYLNNGDYLVLASDGIHTLPDELIELFIHKNHNPQDITNQIIQQIVQANDVHQDNVSVYVIHRAGSAVVSPNHEALLELPPTINPNLRANSNPQTQPNPPRPSPQIQNPATQKLNHRQPEPTPEPEHEYEIETQSEWEAEAVSNPNLPEEILSPAPSTLQVEHTFTQTEEFEQKWKREYHRTKEVEAESYGYITEKWAYSPALTFLGYGLIIAVIFVIVIVFALKSAKLI